MGGWIVSYFESHSVSVVKLITEHPALYFSRKRVNRIESVIRVEPDDFAEVEQNFKFYREDDYA